ncbi:hypothetical protein C8F01DRAFT_1087356 [Mycena amicta]|nr:hypothetical protein C8F01DRAFT_1087356 [Mycena amicta]
MSSNSAAPSSQNGVKPPRTPTCSVCRQRKLVGLYYSTLRRRITLRPLLPLAALRRANVRVRPQAGGSAADGDTQGRRVCVLPPQEAKMRRSIALLDVSDKGAFSVATALTRRIASLPFDWDSALAARLWPRQLGTVAGWKQAEASPAPISMKHSDPTAYGSKLAFDWPWQTYTQGPLPTLLAGTESEAAWNAFVPDLDLNLQPQYATRPGGEVTVVPSTDDFMLSILNSLHDSSQQFVGTMPQQDLGTRNPPLPGFLPASSGGHTNSSQPMIALPSVPTIPISIQMWNAGREAITLADSDSDSGRDEDYYASVWKETTLTRAHVPQRISKGRAGLYQ